MRSITFDVGTGRRAGMRAFLFGMAHAFDVGGTLAASRGRFGRGPECDAEALRQDWLRATNAVQADGRAGA